MRPHLIPFALVLQCTAAFFFGLATTAHGNQVVEQAAVERPTFVQNGLATWYGERHAGRKTASGEYFDMHALTAAHRTLPFGTVVRVTDLTSGRVIKVRINDRGPNVRASRAILDLSKSAAFALDMGRRGVSRVRIEAYASDQRPPWDL